ncbi:hypothetical protein TWF718_002301 [Orbilia javanica]|uniref:RBR-type E3 ubiquitin transferase n=1 Tax=Orbilia javanica TaxID=47235 RepID=A0AAN8MQI1_9PEZI
MSEMSDDDFLSGGSEDEFMDESMESDFEEEDGVQYLDDKDDRPQKKAYEVDFSVLTEAEIKKAQTDAIDESCAILALTPENAAVLLRHFKWNKDRMIEQYMDGSQKLLEEAGVDLTGSNKPELRTVPGFMCDICCEDGNNLQTFSLRCNHRYCADCYRHYLSQKIKEEGEAIRIQCPSDGCRVLVDPKSIVMLAGVDVLSRYYELLNRTYVEDRENLRWCPAPNCEYVVDCPVSQKQLHEIVPTVLCTCGHHFCFGCGSNDHQPCPCGLVKKWLKKCEDDSETANWISANTKECPKCQSTIEKNGGCNHMTCRKCKHEFCWVCMGPWNEHGTSWYNCNRYEEKSGIDARDTQAKSRASLERYLHYYNRYANHEQSGKLDKDLYIKTEKKMTMLQSASGMSWIEVQYLDAASKVLQQCRQTLKWTYAFAFYLSRNHLTTIFEDNQKDLEMAVEALSELFEKPTDQLANIKVEMMDKTAYVNNRRVILLDTTAKGLQDGTWEFSVEF